MFFNVAVILYIFIINPSVSLGAFLASASPSLATYVAAATLRPASISSAIHSRMNSDLYAICTTGSLLTDILRNSGVF